MIRIDTTRRAKSGAAALGAACLALLAGSAHAQITASNWGTVTAPVYGTTDAKYAGAELTAGPAKFGDGNYFHGVLPNGRKVLPAGVSVQIGMNPLGAALTPDGKYLITSNDDERENYFPDLDVSAHTDPGSVVAHSAYSLSVIDTATMKVVSQIDTAGKYFIGLQVTGSGPYTVYASGGPENNVKVFTIPANGIIPENADGTPVTPPTLIAILPTLPANQGYVSHYTPNSTLAASTSLPSGFSGKRRGDDVPGRVRPQPRRQVPVRGLQRRQQPGRHRHRHQHASSSRSPSATSPTASRSAGTAAAFWSPTGA